MSEKYFITKNVQGPNNTYEAGGLSTPALSNYGDES
jgi:hypothetical protein